LNDIQLGLNTVPLDIADYKIQYASLDIPFRGSFHDTGSHTD